jgi:nitrogen-specific signal transduction histidine kinase
MTASEDFSHERLCLIEKLAGGVAHEINNPLQSVLNNAYLIEASTDQPNISGYALEIQRASAELSQLMGTLLDLLRPERAARVLDVAQVVDGGLQLLGYALRNAQVSVRVQVETGVPRVTGDPGLLLLAVLEILTVALSGEKLASEIQREKQINVSVSRVLTGTTEWVELGATVRAAREPVFSLAQGVAARWQGHFRSEVVPGSRQHKVVLALPAAAA